MQIQLILTILGIILYLISPNIIAKQQDSSNPNHKVQPQRIISINVCTDILLLLLAKEQQLSVTFLAKDLADYIDLPPNLHFNRGILEQIIVFKPDIILAHSLSNSLLLQRLRQLQQNLIIIDAAQNIEQIYLNILQVAENINNLTQAHKLISTMQQQLQTMPQFTAQNTLVFYPNGFVAGNNTLANSVLKQLNLHNLATDLGIEYWGKLSLEQIIKFKPEIIIFSLEQVDTPALATKLLQHPVLRHARHITVDNKLWQCANPLIIQLLHQITSFNHQP
jgi:iron complex transport system substrate-binding protein